ncbi:UDP-3-O-(3-hydroxymyristoyl)glucosamine N-acyltransferase [bacterium]|nr:UDP-3-O-(3-hydroxymyristoyl)glucosamine N-acyltransferase [candidate division CSSED10-310 bacterium]
MATLVGGIVKGDAAFQVANLAPVDQAGPHDLTFLTNPKYEAALRESGAGAVITAVELPWFPGHQLLVAEPYLAFAKLLVALHPPYRPAPGIHPSAVLGEDVLLGADCAVGPHVSIGAGCRIGDRVALFPGVVIGPGCRIGDDCLLHPNVVLMDGVRLGNRVTINAGSVIGAEGYGFVWDGSRHFKIPQVGVVVIEDDVELGANNTIDRATLGETRIGTGVKTDDQVHLAHNVRVGDHSLIVAQTGVSGSTRIGTRATIAGQVGIAGHITIGDNVTIAARTGVTRSIGDNRVVAGLPAMDIRAWRRVIAVYQQLPALLERIRKLEHTLLEMKEKNEA